MIDAVLKTILPNMGGSVVNGFSMVTLSRQFPHRLANKEEEEDTNKQATYIFKVQYLKP